jgi:hypothetical protein
MLVLLLTLLLMLVLLLMLLLLQVPPKFATLLQLRELLSISDKRAEAIEEDILAAGASFSI